MNEESEGLYKEAQRRLREVTTLYEASQACLSISDQKGLLTAIIEAAARATDAALGSVMLIDEEKGEYVFGAHYGLSQETIAAIEAELHIPLGEGLVGSVVTAGQPVVVADVTTDPRWIPTETKEPMRSFLGVPLVGRAGRPLGALSLSHPEVGAFDEDHARLLSTFANQAAMAIENARLYEQAQQEITERKRAIETFRESEERYRRLVELSFDAIAIHREGRVVYINATGAELFGASSPEELVAKPILDFVHPDYLEIAEARVLQVTEGRAVSLIEEKLIRLDGTSVDAEVVGIPITYQGQPAVQVVVRDITERKRAEEELRWLKEFNEGIVQSMTEGIIVDDAEGCMTFVNPAAAALLGYSPAQLLGQHWKAIVPPDQWAIVQAADERRARGEADRYELQLIHRDGTRVPVLVSGSPRFEEGRFAGTLAVFTDITERKRAEEDLRESEKRLDTILNSVQAGIVVIDAETRVIVDANPVAIEMIGMPKEQVVGHVCHQFICPAEKDRCPITDLGQSVDRSERVLLNASGQSIPILKSVIPTILGRRRHLIESFLDITERKRAEEALRESEAKYSALVEQALDGVVIVQDGVCRFANRAMAESSGYAVEEIVGIPFLERVAPESKHLVAQRHKLRMAGEKVLPIYEARIQCKDGTIKDVEISAGIIQYEGRPADMAIVRDITGRKKLEEQLRQAQKMEAVGTLAGGIAHDFNNILTGILGFASLVHSELPTDSSVRLDVETIIRSARRGSELTRQLLAFARRRRVELHSLSLNDIAREVMGLLERTIDKAIAIEPHLAKDLATVEGNAGQIQQMLLNLCLNARDAMPQGGRLIIETQNVTLSEEKARTELNLEAGQYVLLSVTDTGIGMDAETQQHLFEPFFTTKEQGRGLGLAMAFGIVRGHGGAIHVYSEPGQGSTLKVYLPVASRSTEDTAPEEVEVVGGTETVLVVDDEEPVRALLRRILEEGGYTVLLTTDGFEAVELYTRLSTKIDMVVLDIIMPQMSGWETYERLREINPEVKVLLSSGYSENGQAQDILAAGARGFLQKPYDPRAVLRKVREVLEG
ncbi:MAG: PAS domain S-box protein [Anaerolineae bacterium]